MDSSGHSALCYSLCFNNHAVACVGAADVGAVLNSEAPPVLYTSNRPAALPSHNDRLNPVSIGTCTQERSRSEKDLRVGSIGQWACQWADWTASSRRRLRGEMAAVLASGIALFPLHSIGLEALTEPPQAEFMR